MRNAEAARFENSVFIPPHKVGTMIDYRQRKMFGGRPLCFAGKGWAEVHRPLVHTPYTVPIPGQAVLWLTDRRLLCCFQGCDISIPSVPIVCLMRV